MSPEQIRSAIQNNAAILTLAQAPVPDLSQIAILLSDVLPKTIVENGVITPRGSAALFPSVEGLPGPLAFQKAIKKISSWVVNAKSSVSEQVSLLAEAVDEQLYGYRNLGLDFGSPALRSMLDLLASMNVINAQELAGFKSLAEKKYVPTETEIKRAIWSDDGTKLV